jgi:hypothetical protein
MNRPLGHVPPGGVTQSAIPASTQTRRSRPKCFHTRDPQGVRRRSRLDRVWDYTEPGGVRRRGGVLSCVDLDRLRLLDGRAGAGVSRLPAVEGKQAVLAAAGAPSADATLSALCGGRVSDRSRPIGAPPLLVARASSAHLRSGRRDSPRSEAWTTGSDATSARLAALIRRRFCPRCGDRPRLLRARGRALGRCDTLGATTRFTRGDGCPRIKPANRGPTGPRCAA